MTEDERAFWDRAYCAALIGMLAKHGDCQSDALAASVCSAHADAALSARSLRTEKDKP